MKPKCRLPAALVVTGLLCAPMVASGSWESFREVHGIVLDRESHPVDHAVVQIQNNRTLMVRSYITQSDGEYHFAGLDPDDDYQLMAEYDGLWSRTRTFSRFDSGKNRKINLTVRLGR